MYRANGEVQLQDLSAEGTGRLTRVAPWYRRHESEEFTTVWVNRPLRAGGGIRRCWRGVRLRPEVEEMAPKINAVKARALAWGRLTVIVVVSVGVTLGLGSSGPVNPGAARRALDQGQASVGRSAGAAVAGEPQVCSGCHLPLTYLNGPVMGTTAAGVTVTPIYWEPGGGKYKFGAGYEDIINGYVANVAAASGQDTNVFSVATEYYQVVGGSRRRSSI
jgi:hypothetical protein